MTTVELITALFYEVDEQMGALPKHPEAHLWPSEVVTLGRLHALKGGGNRPFYGEQGDAGDYGATPVQWPGSFTCHSNPGKRPYACQTSARPVQR
jgi:hypothetical protein